jgi:hypothetical protein
MLEEQRQVWGGDGSGGRLYDYGYHYGETGQLPTKLNATAVVMKRQFYIGGGFGDEEDDV